MTQHTFTKMIQALQYGEPRVKRQATKRILRKRWSSAFRLSQTEDMLKHELQRFA
jgi:hypothetical protein